MCGICSVQAREISNCCWLCVSLLNPEGKYTWGSFIQPVRSSLNSLLVLQQPLSMYCIITELNCDLMWLVYVGARSSEPSSALRVKGLSERAAASPTSGQKSPLPGRETVLGSGFTLLLAQAHVQHKQTHILHRGNTTSSAVLSILEGWMELRRIW